MDALSFVGLRLRSHERIRIGKWQCVGDEIERPAIAHFAAGPRKGAEGRARQRGAEADALDPGGRELGHRMALTREPRDHIDRLGNGRADGGPQKGPVQQPVGRYV